MNAPHKPDEIKPAKPRTLTAPRKSLAPVRLRKHADFQRAYSAARKRQSASISWFLAAHRGIGTSTERDGGSAPSRPSGPRVGLTAGKVLGKAHERNRIKRRMREVLRRHLDLFPEDADLILHPRRVVLTMEFAKLEAEVVRILTQARAEAAKTASHPAVASPA
jgi:ribonuclease P protein component